MLGPAIYNRTASPDQKKNVGHLMNNRLSKINDGFRRSYTHLEKPLVKLFELMSAAVSMLPRAK